MEVTRMQRSNVKRVPLCYRITPAAKRDLEASAEKNGRLPSRELEALIAKHLPRTKDPLKDVSSTHGPGGSNS